MLSFARTIPTVVAALAGLSHAYTYTTPHGVTCDTANPGIGFPTAGSTVYIYKSSDYAGQVYFNMTLCGTSYDGDSDSSIGAMFLLSLNGGGTTEYVLNRTVAQSEDDSDPSTYPGIYYEQTVGVQYAESSAAPAEGETRNIIAYEYFTGHSGQSVTIRTIAVTFTYNAPTAASSTSTATAGQSSTATSSAAPSSTSSCSYVEVTFNEKVTTAWQEDVRLVGSISELGFWQVGSGVLLSAGEYTTSNPLWTGTVNLEAGTSFEYKYVVLGADGTITWESDPNQSYTVPSMAAGCSATVSNA